MFSLRINNRNICNIGGWSTWWNLDNLILIGIHTRSIQDNPYERDFQCKPKKLLSRLYFCCYCQHLFYHNHFAMLFYVPHFFHCLFHFAKLSPSSSSSWAELALFSLNPATHPICGWSSSICGWSSSICGWSSSICGWSSAHPWKFQSQLLSSSTQVPALAKLALPKEAIFT